MNVTWDSSLIHGVTPVSISGSFWLIYLRAMLPPNCIYNSDGLMLLWHFCEQGTLESHCKNTEAGPTKDRDWRQQTGICWCC